MPDGPPRMTSFTPGPETVRDFREALGRFATGVTVVTCGSPEGPLGITANSFASVSLDPPLVLWSPARASRRFAAFEAAERFAVHVLGADQTAICRAFVNDGLGAFRTVRWSPGAGDVPRIDGCLARFDCARHASHDGGDHAIIVGRVLHCEVAEGAPLVFSQGVYGRFSKAGD